MAIDKQTREIIKFVRDMQGRTDKFKNRDRLSGQYRQEDKIKGLKLQNK